MKLEGAFMRIYWFIDSLNTHWYLNSSGQLLEDNDQLTSSIPRIHQERLFKTSLRCCLETSDSVVSNCNIVNELTTGKCFLKRSIVDCLDGYSSRARVSKTTFIEIVSMTFAKGSALISSARIGSKEQSVTWLERISAPRNYFITCFSRQIHETTFQRWLK